MSVIRSVCAVALLLCTATASRAQAPSAPATGQPASADAGISSQERARRERVFARFTDGTVTVGEIEDAVAEQSPFQRRQYAEDRTRLRELGRRLVETKLLAAEARRQGLAREASVRDVSRENAVQLLVRRQFDERITPQSVTDADVTGYYQSHIDEFSRPEMVRASQIVVATEADARALATEIATADAARFRQLARERSLDDETKLSGGDLRYFTRDGRAVGGRERPIDPAVVAAAFAIGEVGGVSAPVLVGGRYSVLKLTGRRPAETTPLAQASEGVRRRVWRERRQEAIDTFVAELRRAAAVTMRVERLRAIVLDEAPATLGEGDGHAHGRAPEVAPPTAPATRPR
jgi:peptidyl-prolyl cis-trans isomerase C